VLHEPVPVEEVLQGSVEILVVGVGAQAAVLLIHPFGQKDGQ